MARDLRAGTNEVHQQAGAVVRFWLEEVPAAKRFARDAALDQEITRRFETLRAGVVAGHAVGWRGNADALLAAVILIDQFGRNLFRGSAEAFAADPLARGLVDEAIAKGWADGMTAEQQQFLFMPLMHSETMADQVRGLALFGAIGGEPLAFAGMHAAQIVRFGRFPQRNAVLGRETTPEEAAFLADPAHHF